MEDQTKQNMSNVKSWTRIIYLILFAIAFNVAEFIIAAITIVQFFTTLFTGSPNERLAEMGGSLGDYIGEVTSFLTYKTEHMPFPVSDWGQGPERPSARGRAAAKEAGATIITPAPSAPKKKAAKKKATTKKSAKKKDDK